MVHHYHFLWFLRKNGSKQKKNNGPAFMLPATEFGKDLLPELLRHKEKLKKSVIRDGNLVFSQKINKMKNKFQLGF